MCISIYAGYMTGSKGPRAVEDARPHSLVDLARKVLYIIFSESAFFDAILKDLIQRQNSVSTPLFATQSSVFTTIPTALYKCTYPKNCTLRRKRIYH
jgi:hypothetical protein